MVYSMDENVGRVLDMIRNLGLEEETVIVFTSDNGGLSTQMRGQSPTSNLPLRAGKGWCYEGGIREPLIVRAPGLTQAGTVCSVPVTSMDFYPTLLDLAGLPLRPASTATA
jgi:arylsulfatase A-like enzyme